MKIAGFQKCSMVDYPGKVAAVVFTPGCNMNCFYCHNRVLLARTGGGTRIPIEVVMATLEKRRRLLDGVVVTGGEATLQPGLDDFLAQVRTLGLATKLDTNGTRPDVLRKLIDENLLDFVAMDLKAPLSRYEEICGTRVDLAALEESIELITGSGVEHEFRTTFNPVLSEQDVVNMAHSLGGARTLVLQQYRQPAIQPDWDDPRIHQPSHPAEMLRRVAERITQEAAVQCSTRGI